MAYESNGLKEFLDVLPGIVRERLERIGELESLIEVVLDYGRPAEARYRDRVERWNDVIVSEHDLEYVNRSIGEFGEDNRAGIERTLHRISAIRNRHGRIIGLSCRVGRALEGTIDIIDDIVRSGASILLLGRPGVGKTTKLREVARVLADEVGKRVVIVDTSNEIAGDGDVPHPGIGSARRMQVRTPALQHQVMIEAVENHMPEVIVIDEISTEAEALASRTIAERGVQLVATAHGRTLENLMLNPSLADLVGGIQAVTLSDDEAKRRGTQKTVLERKAPPTFDVLVELVDFARLAVHHNVQKTVDLILRGIAPRPEIRVRTDSGAVEVVQRENSPELMEPGFGRRFPSIASVPPAEESPRSRRGSARPASGESDPEAAHNGTRNGVAIYPYGIARTRLERAIRERRASAYVTGDVHQADAIMAIRSGVATRPKKLREMAGRSVPTVIVKSNTYAQIASALDALMQGRHEESDGESEAMDEVLLAIEVVTQTGKPYDLAPRSAPLRKLQHQVAESHRLASESFGEEPHRRLRILPAKLA